MLHAYFAGCSVGVRFAGSNQTIKEKAPRVVIFANDVLSEAFRKRPAAPEIELVRKPLFLRGAALSNSPDAFASGVT
jgi:hypothetical protein